MKKLLSFIKSKILMLILALVLPLSATGVVLTFSDYLKTSASTLSYNTSYISEATLTNGNFNSSTSTDSLSTSLSGWTGQKPSSSATAGIINVGTSFSGSRYYLEENPLAKASDKKILMINSKTSSSGSYQPSQQGYVSSVISLATNSYYCFKVSFKSANFNNDNTFGSIYLTGLVDEDGNNVEAAFKKISSDNWVTYNFFLATGNTSQTVKLGLWLGGSENNNKSSGVVFFDDCHLFQYSENAFWSQYKANANNSYTQEYTIGASTETKEFKTTNLTDLREDNSLDFTGFNFDFENGIYTNDAQPVSQWSKTGNGSARVFNVSSPEFFKTQTGYDFVGSNLSCKVNLDGTIALTNNQYVLGLWANDGYVKLTSKDIEINTNTIYKITAYYKIASIENGSAYMIVSENNNVLEAYNLPTDYYTLATEQRSAALSTNGSSKFINEYKTVEFYVKGGPLYNSSINLALALGSDEESATGAITFDDITIERASSNDYENASNKIALGTISGSTTVTNGAFNIVSFDADSTAPYSADNWEVSNSGNLAFAGVINTSQDEYAKYVALYNEYNANGVEDGDNPYVWASFYPTAPGNANGSTTTTNNAMMLANINTGTQTLKSSDIELSSNTKAVLSFAFKSTANVNIKVVSSTDIKLYESGNISSGVWKNYEIYFSSADSSTTLHIEITLSSTNAGFAFFDNFEFYTDVSDETFSEKVESATGRESDFGVVDMSNNYFNLTTNDITDDLETSSAAAYTSELVSGNADSNLAGVVKSTKFDNTSALYIDGEDTPVFFFSNQTIGSRRIQSKYSISLTSGYYMLSFKVKTNFIKAESELDEDKTYNYGLTVGLSNFDYVKNIRCDDNYEVYKIYLHPTESTTSTLYLEFVSDSLDTLGSAVVYDIALSNDSSVETDYEQVSSTIKSDDYALNANRVAIAKVSDAEESEETDEDEQDTDNSTATNNNLNWSLIISGVITGLAIILAVVFSVLKNIKIKKIEIKRKESYDRKSSLEINALKKRAEEQQRVEAKEVKTNVDKLQTELDRLEKEHKEKVVALRASDKDKVSKETDKEFRDFAKKRAVIAEKIDSLNKKIEDIKSPEYLLNLERKLYAQDEAEKRTLKKASKKNK